MLACESQINWRVLPKRKCAEGDLDRQVKQEKIMKNTFLSLLVAAGLLFCAAGLAKAQNTVTPQPRAASYALMRQLLLCKGLPVVAVQQRLAEANAVT